MSRSIIRIACAAAALTLASAASAATMTVAYSPAQATVGNGKMSFNGGANFTDVGVGRLAFQVYATDLLDPIGPILYAFCIEPTQWVNTSPTPYSVVALPAGNTTMGGIGGAKASLVRQLFARNLPNLSGAITTQAAAAMQFAIWEIVGETGPTFDVLAGNARFQSSVAGALSLAQAYLSALTTGGPEVNNLFAINSATQQDQVIQLLGNVNIPEPATLGLLGLGGLALIVRRRRRA